MLCGAWPLPGPLGGPGKVEALVRASQQASAPQSREPLGREAERPAVAIDAVHPTSLSVRWGPVSSVDVGEPNLRVWLGDVEPDATCVVAGQPGILGRIDRNGERIVFRPRLGFRSGRVYTACLSGSRGDAEGAQRLWTEQFAIEPGGSEAPAPPPRIVSVWPRPGSVIPANTLRFYVEFDQPMRAAAVDRAVRLLDASGSPIEDALVPIPEGLWDARQRRLTVALHPGRIKQGVGPRETQGAALVPGAAVRLQVGAELRSEVGVAMGSEVFEYPIGPADREPPDPARWRLVPPPTSYAVLELELDERLDPAVLRRAVRVFQSGAGGWTPVAVDLRIEDAGRLVHATPTGGVWRPGSYRLEVLGVVEDLAGNRPGRAFDANLDEAAPVGGERRTPEWFSFAFEVPDPEPTSSGADAPTAPPR